MQLPLLLLPALPGSSARLSVVAALHHLLQQLLAVAIARIS
jgi:hypothetical protein